MVVKAKPSIEKEPTIVQLVDGLPRLRIHEELIEQFEENRFTSTFPIVDKATYLGIEVETENVQYWNENLSPYWKMTEDGSLRNSGREFISHPIRAMRVENALTCLFSTQLNKDIEFTDRTSIHVHMNIRTLTIRQLKSIILCYLIFERSLFKFIGNNREDNIFCVPLLSTDFGSRLQPLIENSDLNNDWMKYTALNLLPVFDKGTIEFRHCHGTKDIPYIITWINLLLCLKKFALRNEPEYILNQIENLNTTSNYHMFASEVFGYLLPNLWGETSSKDMEEGVSYVKTYCLTNRFKSELVRTDIEEGTPFHAIKQKQTYTLRYGRDTATVELSSYLSGEPEQVWPRTIRDEARDFVLDTLGEDSLTWTLNRVIQNTANERDSAEATEIQTRSTF